MRIAGDTIRRSYLSRYEKNYSDKFDSEKKIYSGRKFDRASENPIDAARALRVRKTLSEVESYEDNLKTANSIYTNAEGSMSTVSTIIQSVYEKLVEGAHGTRNPDDLNIIAMDIDNYAEEMVQSFNIDIADRRVFGGVNNETPAFKIEGSTDAGKYVTYNGVALNSSSDPYSFPHSEQSYLDIGIGINIDGNTDRIDDQSALPVTFNGAEVTGCGMTSKTATIDISSLKLSQPYSLEVYVGGRHETVEFMSGDTQAQSVENINAALKEAFQTTPEVDNTGKISYAGESPEWYTYKNAPFNSQGGLDFGSMEKNVYYSVKVELNGETKVVDFKGGETNTETYGALASALSDAFGDETQVSVDKDGRISTGTGRKEVFAKISNASDYKEVGSIEDEDGKRIDLASIGASGNGVYAINLNGKKVSILPGANIEETMKNANESLSNSGVFGKPVVPYINDSGTLAYDVEGENIQIDNTKGFPNEVDYTEIDGYPKNLIQLVLDSAKLLRKGDQDMVARYADLVYAAQSNLSVAISDLGTHSKFIEFNQDRLADVKVNLLSRQNDIESTDLPSEITNWKVLESVYNASLQMGSSVLSQTIFNYIS